MAKSKDLFDDTTMSFGEHLEVLRIHLWKAIVGLVIGVIVALFFGGQLVAFVRAPIDHALRKHGAAYVDPEFAKKVEEFSLREYIGSFFAGDERDEPQTETEAESRAEASDDEAPSRPEQIDLWLRASDVALLLHTHDPETYPEPKRNEAEQRVRIAVHAPEFRQFRETSDRINQPITLNVQEAFFTYLKVAFVAGLLLTSPWVFYQIWLFVAAGLYPHERKYVYTYLPLSIGLFLGGAVFCFYAVFPFVLEFLLGFNKTLDVTPQIRLSEWISFAILLPVMFGISFQLPMVMLFLERISVFEAQDYRDKRRMAILTIAIVSMFLTPADPVSMIMMMVPLLGLYEFGILLCSYSPAKSPFQAEAPS
jgi:sec-independent protein translocase protein TatC